MPEPVADFDDKALRKRPRPTLTSSWWKTAWPHPNAPRCQGDMTRALKALKTAQGGRSAIDLAAALAGVRGCADTASAEAASRLRGLPKRLKAIQTDLEALIKLADAAEAKLAAGGSRQVLVYKRDFGKALTDSLYDFHNMDIRSIRVEIHLLQAVVDELASRKADALLHSGYSDAFDAAVASCDKELRSLLAKRFGRSDKRTLSQMEKIIAGHLEGMRSEQAKVPARIFKRLGLQGKIAEAYARRMKADSIDIVNKVALTGLSAAAIALPGTQGLAIYGFVRSFLSVSQQIGEHFASASTRAALLIECLEGVEKNYRKLEAEQRAATKSAAAQEIGGTALNRLIGVDIVPTLSKAKEHAKILEEQIEYVSYGMRESQDLIGRMMDKMAALKKSLPAAALDPIAVQKSPAGKRIRKLEKALDSLVSTAAGRAAKIAAVEKSVKPLKKRVKALDDGTSRLVKGIAAGTGILVDMGVATAGLADASSAYSALCAAEKASKGVLSVATATIGEADALKGALMELTG
ncbi:MAG: hypothetical protein AAGD12_08850 [Pseudomonadota bacterium]